jgi:hypothetical protein
MTTLFTHVSAATKFKADFYPRAEDIALGRRVLHPLKDNLSNHVRENLRTGELEPLTEYGRFHIALLRLNRPPLVHYRLRRRLLVLLGERLHFLEAEIIRLREICATQESYLAMLRELLESERRRTD